MWIMFATFGVCFKFVTLLVFEIPGTQKSWKKLYILLPVQHNSRPLRYVDQSKMYTGYMWIIVREFFAVGHFVVGQFAVGKNVSFG